jgi:hypothetical protein
MVYKIYKLKFVPLENKSTARPFSNKIPLIMSLLNLEFIIKSPKC